MDIEICHKRAFLLDNNRMCPSRLYIQHQVVVYTFEVAYIDPLEHNLLRIFANEKVFAAFQHFPTHRK